MSRFNVLMQNKFMGCMVIGIGKDTCRNRHVVLYALPDDEVHVGIHDGIDSWIASAAQNPFGLDAAQRLREIGQGVVFEIEQGQTFRRFEDGTYQREEGAPRTRKRLGGAMPALPIPIAPIASPLAGPPSRHKIAGPTMNMPSKESTGIPIAPPRRRIIAAPAPVAPVKERRRVSF